MYAIAKQPHFNALAVGHLSIICAKRVRDSFLVDRVEVTYGKYEVNGQIRALDDREAQRKSLLLQILLSTFSHGTCHKL